MANRILKPNMGRLCLPGQKPPYGARINPKHPLAQGLVGAWLFNEGGGNNVFDLANGNRSYEGTIHNPAGGMWQGSGLKFPGSGTPILTIGPWLQLRYATFVAGIIYIDNGSTQQIINSDQTSGSARVFQFRTSDADKLNLIVFSSGVNSITGSTTLESGKYYNVCGKSDGSNINIYVNGKIDATPVACGLIDTSANSITHIGAFQQNVGDYTNISNVSNSFISYAYIYNRPLSDSEVISLHADPYQMFDWPLQDFLMGEISAEDFSGWSDLIKNTLKLDYAEGSYSGDQSRKTGKYSVGSFPSIGAATKKTTKTFEGVWSSIADLISQLVGAAQKFYQDCISILAPAGIILKKSTHNFSGALTSVATMVRKGIKSLAGTSTFVGDITKFIGKKIIRTFSTLGELLAQKSGIIYQVCLAGLTFSAKSIKSSSTKLSGAIQTIGTLIKKSLPKSLSGFLNSSAKIIRMPIKLTTGTANFIGTISRFTYKKIIRTFTTIGDILTQKTGAIYKSLAAGLTFSGNAIKSYSMKLSGVFQDLGAIIKKPLKIVKGGFTTAASVDRLRGRILTAILSSTGTIYRKTFTELKSNLNQSGSLIKSINIILISIKSLIGDLLTRVFRTIIGILHHRTYFVPFMDREILLPTDGRTYVIEKDDNTYEINE